MRCHNTGHSGMMALFIMTGLFSSAQNRA
jgi:hypothetical protein